jgi:hypothetical protein
LLATLTVLSERPAQAAGCSPGWKDAGDGVCEKEFKFSGAIQTVTVPSGVVVLTAVVSGGAGGTSLEDEGAASPGGKGGRQTATFSVTPGEVLTVMVGEAGSDGVLEPTGPGGWPSGGHAASRYGGNGGGGSYLFDSAGVLVAAGGGGGGGHDYNPAWSGTGDQKNRGGHGAGATAAKKGRSVHFLGSPDPRYGSPGAGRGATPDHGGKGGKPDLPPTWGGFGISTGETGWGPTIDPEILGKGGDSYRPTDTAGVGMGGGGGGGHFGGGGGGTIDSMVSGGGGGGGAGFVTARATTSTAEVGVQKGNGEITLSYVR